MDEFFQELGALCQKHKVNIENADVFQYINGPGQAPDTYKLYCAHGGWPLVKKGNLIDAEQIVSIETREIVIKGSE